jgi:Ca-activated chloride channel family protein
MIVRLAEPILLAVLGVLVPWFVWCLRRRDRGVARLHLPWTSEVLRLGRTTWSRLEPWLPWLRGVVLLLLVLALARPQAGSTRETVSSEGIDMVVALDVSDSMRALDFQPLNRLEVAKRTLEEFVDGRPGDRIGLVSFASHAGTRCPLTLDHDLLRTLLGEVDFAAEDEGGTAIGMGLATAVQRLRGSKADSRVVVLLTDGRNNRGQIGPEAAAEAARALGVRVYTVGVGTRGLVPVPTRGGGITQQRFDLDEDLLERIAEVTDGRYFRATDPDALRETLAVIGELETSPVESEVRVLYAERFPAFLVAALLLLAFEWTLSIGRLRRVP